MLGPVINHALCSRPRIIHEAHKMVAELRFLLNEAGKSLRPVVSTDYKSLTNIPTMKPGSFELEANKQPGEYEQQRA